MKRSDKLKLGALVHPTGNHLASWLHPGSQLDGNFNFKHYVNVGRTAERGLFDLIFMADYAAVRDGNPEAMSRWPQYMAFFEPLTVLAGIAASTTHIGLVATRTTTYNEPYNVARVFASLDHISSGRAGWNVVTSSNQLESLNFGKESHAEHSDRYARAHEFVAVVKGLWDSWEDDAFMMDRAAQRYYDPKKIHALEHRGDHFRVEGPLNIARPPQGYPVIFQAGSSEAGKELAAETAEVVFSVQDQLDRARDFYVDVKARMEKYGRSQDQLKIMPGLNPVVGDTEAEAAEKHQYLQSLIHPSVGLEILSNALGGVSMASVKDVDKPLTTDFDNLKTNASKSAFELVRRWTVEEGLTVRQLYLRFAGARGHRTIIGTPSKIASEIEEWFNAKAVDGYLIQPPVYPTSLDEFVDKVIPELQHRGIFRTQYEGTTLRDRLGLNRPANRYAQKEN